MYYAYSQRGYGERGSYCYGMITRNSLRMHRILSVVSSTTSLCLMSITVLLALGTPPPDLPADCNKALAMLGANNEEGSKFEMLTLLRKQWCPTGRRTQSTSEQAQPPPRLEAASDGLSIASGDGNHWSGHQ